MCFQFLIRVYSRNSRLNFFPDFFSIFSLVAALPRYAFLRNRYLRKICGAVSLAEC